MKGKNVRVHLIFSVLLGLSAAVFAEDDAPATPPPVQVVVSVSEQRLALLHEGGLVKRYPISTSKFGLGDSFGSYKTPVGQLRVCDKIGEGLSVGAVIKHRNATGEILPVNAPGRDPIVTRILWLEGLETRNDNARSRGIYIHGTVEESKVGDPVSYGCIRMKSRDVAELFNSVPVGTPVEIIEGRFPRFHKPAAPKPEVIIAKKEPAAPAKTEARHTLAAAPRPAEKAAATGPALFGDRPAKTTAAASRPTEDEPQARPAKVPARAVLLAEGREVPTGRGETTTRRIEVSMRKSILFAGLPEIASAPAEKDATKRPH